MSATDWWALFHTTAHPSFPVREAGSGDFGSFGAGETHEDGLSKTPPIDHSTGHDREGIAVVSPEEETDHGLPTTAKADDVCFGQDASAIYRPTPPNRDLPRLAETVKTAKTLGASPHETGFGNFGGFGTGLQEAVRAATKLGATFRIVGADIEIDGDLPDESRAALPVDQLYAYFGAAAADNEAVEFLAQLQVLPILVTDAAGATAAMGALAGADPIGLDLETAPPGARPEPVMINSTGKLAASQPGAGKAGLDPHTAVIQTAQLYAGGEHAYVFHGEALHHLLNSERLYEQHFVAHGADFETQFLQHHLANSANNDKDPTRTLPLIECTLQGIGLLHGVEGRKRSLAAASKTMLHLDPPKLLQTSAWAAPRLSVGQIAYAASDAVLAFRLWREVEQALKSKGRYTAYEVQRNAIAAVADTELRGIAFDLKKHARLVAGWKIDITTLEQKIIDLTGQPPPAKKTEEQAWIVSVAGDLLATWPRTTKSNELSTTAAAYALLENVPAARLMLELRAKKKLLSTYGDNIARQVNPVTGRLHASYSISGAKTGRFSCSGPNLQNQPSLYKAPDYKNLFIATPGSLLLTGDWKQVELRAMAYVSGCPDMTAVFEAGGDLHLETALAMVGKRCEDIPAEELAVLRSRAKAVNFSVIYGSTGKGLAETAWKNYGIKMKVAEGSQAIAQFFEKRPKVKRWMERSLIEGTLHGRVLIGCGRVVEVGWEETRRFSPQQCANYPIQGICADAMLRALALTYDRLRAANITGGIIGSIHDELLVEVAEADAKKARQILETAMTEAFEQTFPGAPTTGGVVEIKGGPSWGECKLLPSEEQ
jgi:DNA polymerase-1